jgi:hypothetical protein
MDDLLEHQRRQEEDEFWDEKQRDAARPKSARGRDLSTFLDEAPPTMKSMPAPEEVRNEVPERTAESPAFRNLAPRQPADKTRSLGLLLAIALLVLGALGYQGYRIRQKRNVAVLTTGAVEAVPALPSVLGAVPLPSPAVEPPPQMVVPAEPAGPTPEQVELNGRLDRLEARLKEVIEGLRAQGYIVGDAGANGEPLLPSAFAPRQVAPVAAAPMRRIPMNKSMPVAPAAKTPPAVTRQQLLSVDMWDGRPSVVVGNGDPKNPQVRVLQQGDSFNGITLNAVDVAGQRATFTDGVRSISLDVSH